MVLVEPDHPDHPDNRDARKGSRKSTPPASGGGGTDVPRMAWGRFARAMRPQLNRGSVVGLLMAILLGFAISTQVQSTRNQSLETLREEDLVRILDDLSQTNTRLDREIIDLERTRDDLRTGAGPAAAKAARDRADTLGILAGTLRATGPGITMTINDPQRTVQAANLIDVVQELRDAGAEAIQIGSVRVVASTSFTDNDGIEADGTRLQAPYRIIAIGTPATMSSAMAIPGGVSDTIRRLGGSTKVEEFESVTVDALHSVQAPRYAQPVPTTAQ